MEKIKNIIQFVLVFFSIILIVGENPNLKTFIITKIIGFITIYIIAKINNAID